MPKPFPWLTIAALGVLVGCGKPAVDAEAPSSGRLRVQAYDAPLAKAPLGRKLETMKPRAEAAAGPASAGPRPAAESPPVRLPLQRDPDPTLVPPMVSQPPRDLYAGHPAPPPAAAEPSGFRLTVPVCRRAQRQGDPLAGTPECAQLIEAARAQAEACRQAYEDGNDAVAFSPACRQAAGFR